MADTSHAATWLPPCTPQWRTKTQRTGPFKTILVKNNLNVRLLIKSSPDFWSTLKCLFYADFHLQMPQYCKTASRMWRDANQMMATSGGPVTHLDIQHPQSDTQNARRCIPFRIKKPPDLRREKFAFDMAILRGVWEGPGGSAQPEVRFRDWKVELDKAGAG